MEVKQDHQIEKLYRQSRVMAARLYDRGDYEKSKRLYRFSHLCLDVMTGKKFGIAYNSN